MEDKKENKYLKRFAIKIEANPNRVILKFLKLGINHLSDRMQRLLADILSIPDEEGKVLYEQVKKDFAFRHRNFEYYVESNFEKLKGMIPPATELSATKKLLIGAYFTKEYSIQSAALFNPSMVVHPDQNDLMEGSRRFIISFRSVGEGHISSIEFRTGIIDNKGDIKLVSETGFASRVTKNLEKTYDKKFLMRKSKFMRDFNVSILDVFKTSFTYEEYLMKEADGAFLAYGESTQEQLSAIMDSNYDLIADENSSICERVIFPYAKAESMGMEDVRFTTFTENGKTQYIGTYTAYNGHQIAPHLIITNDFVNFKLRTMYGDAVNDKGMALFPEKINGKYAMIGRQGGENITIMFSDDLFLWEDYKTILTPEDPWAYVQIGNSGPPLKTEEGWILITHAVGPLRKYVLGAILLDLKDPSIIIKKLNKPLLSPNEKEREGYVPNVVYSCGSMIHGDKILLPYATSDSASTFAVIDIDSLLNEMETYKSNPI